LNFLIIIIIIIIQWYQTVIQLQQLRLVHQSIHAVLHQNSTPGSINVAEASNYQWSVRLNRAKESMSMKVSSIYNSTTNVNYSESDGEYYFNEATYIKTQRM
jgi:hypothetical protein